LLAVCIKENEMNIFIFLQFYLLVLLSIQSCKNYFKINSSFAEILKSSTQKEQMLKKASYRVDSVLFVGHVSAEVMVRLFQDLLKVRRDVGVKDRVAVAVLDATYPQKNIFLPHNVLH
jgi:hypothetical protein